MGILSTRLGITVRIIRIWLCIAVGIAGAIAVIIVDAIAGMIEHMCKIVSKTKTNGS